MDEKELFQVALAFTVKTSSASSPKDFLTDYEKNKKAFKELQKEQPKDWIY